jgi:hypothetical protein
MGKEMIERKGCKLLLKPFHFVGISRHNITVNNRYVFKLRPSRLKYDTAVNSQGKRRKRLCCELDLAIIMMMMMMMMMIINFNSYLFMC